MGYFLWLQSRLVGGDYSTNQKKKVSVKTPAVVMATGVLKKNKIKNPEFLQMAPLCQKGFYKSSDETERHPSWSRGVHCPCHSRELHT